MHHPLHWKHRVLTTGHLGKSSCSAILDSSSAGGLLVVWQFLLGSPKVTWARCPFLPGSLAGESRASGDLLVPVMINAQGRCFLCPESKIDMVSRLVVVYSFMEVAFDSPAFIWGCAFCLPFVVCSLPLLEAAWEMWGKEFMAQAWGREPQKGLLHDCPQPVSGNSGFKRFLTFL